MTLPEAALSQRSPGPHTRRGVLVEQFVGLAAMAALLLTAVVPVPIATRLGPSVANAQGSVDPGALELTETLRTRVRSFPQSAHVDGERLHSRVLIPQFYQRRDFRPAWTARGSLTPAALELVGTIARATDHGLDPGDYHEAAIRARLGDTGASSGTRTQADADLELLLTDAFLLYGAHLARGKTDPARLFADWKASRRTTDLVPLLESALENESVRSTLASLAPSYPEYRRLQAGLRLYTQNEDLAERADAVPTEDTKPLGADWFGVGDGGKLEPGSRDPRVPALRQRLLAEGYDVTAVAKVEPEPNGTWGRSDGVGDERNPGDATPNDSDYYDAGLATAVREFQARNGLEADGVIGPATLAGLSRTRIASVDRIRVNLERWRWLPERLGPNHIRVNIAEFRVRVFENDAEVRAIDCIVGKTARKSPVFSGRMTHLVLSPTWTVPTNILLKDKLPLIRKDPGYLTANGFEVFAGWGPEARPLDPHSVDWSSVGAGNLPYRIRQKPGPKNALGRVKFMFPNEYDVYLHDTPSREFFAKSERTFSSGCIRIQDPLGLAEYVLRDQPTWSRTQIESVIAEGKERTVNLREPLPVHLLYWTSWADEGGIVYFRKDVYERDVPVLRALDAPPPAEVG